MRPEHWLLVLVLAAGWLATLWRFRSALGKAQQSFARRVAESVREIEAATVAARSTQYATIILVGSSPAFDEGDQTGMPFAQGIPVRLTPDLSAHYFEPMRPVQKGATIFLVGAEHAEMHDVTVGKHPCGIASGGGLPFAITSARCEVGQRIQVRVRLRS